MNPKHSERDESKFLQVAADNTERLCNCLCKAPVDGENKDPYACLDSRPGDCMTGMREELKP